MRFSENNYRKQPVEQEYSEEDSDDYDDDGERGSGQGGTGENMKPKHRRRSKNDNEGRNFECGGCGKSYLSYPALYTHIKQKHQGIQPEGTNTASMNSGRGRGRPRKENKSKYPGEVTNPAE